MSEDIEIVSGEPSEDSTVLLAFPDVGLVGLIAAKHIAQELEMDEIGYITSEKFPPVTVVHDSKPSHPIRIYEKDDFIVITSEIPIPPNLISPFSEKISKWLDEIKAKKAIIFGGLPHQNREEVETPEIHSVPSNDSIESFLKENELHVLEEGFISGINGILLRTLSDKNFPAMYLMAEAHKNYPDPGAAASLLQKFSDLEDVSLDVQELRDKADEIKVAARDLMRQTQKAKQNTAKEQEEEMPIMYG